MKAVLLSGFGGTDKLSLGEAKPPDLKAGMLRLRVRASGLNRADIVQRMGKYPPPPGESELLGLEVAGEVTELAPDVRGWKPGARVMALLAGGGYAEEVAVDAGLVMPIPEGLSFEEAAAIPEVFLTAHHNLYTLAEVKPGERALIHAGASGVGTAAIQLLKTSGAQPFVTVGGPEKVAACRALGAVAIDYKTEDFAEVLAKETAAHGVDVILDPVGASHWEKNFKSLAIGARWVFIGTMSGAEVPLNLWGLMRKRARLIGSTLRSLPLAEKREVVRRFRESFLPRFADRSLKPIVDKVYAAAQVREAHEHMEANRNIGKIILKWD